MVLTSAIAEVAFTLVTPALKPSATPVRRQLTSAWILQAQPVLMIVISVPTINVTGQGHVCTQTTPTPAMMGFSVMAAISAVVEAAFTQVAPVLRTSAIPVRRQLTAALIPQPHLVPMMAIFVPMISVMGRECVDIPITLPPVMTGFSATVMRSVVVESVSI